jgi:uncharacterized protein
MLYAITTGGFANHAQKSAAQVQTMAGRLHSRRVEQLVADGRLVLAGAFPAIDSPDPGPAGVTGNLIVAEFDSLEDAQSWIDADPDTNSGASLEVEVKPFVQTLY